MKKIKVYRDEKAKTQKNSWNWGVFDSRRKTGKKANAVYFSTGFDSMSIARAAARRHNKTLKKELEIEVVK